MRFAPLLIAANLAFGLATTAPPVDASPLTYSDILARPRPKPTQHVAYGDLPDQFGELWLPKRSGPIPVVVFIHGGCWNANLPGLELMNYAAEDLRQRGFAVWNLEYRRLGNGGGYPATFNDIASGVDLLRKLAGPRHLDLKHVVLVGHSAGGQLALWAAARGKLPRTSPLSRPDPLPVRGIADGIGVVLDDEQDSSRRADRRTRGTGWSDFGTALVGSKIRGRAMRFGTICRSY